MSKESEVTCPDVKITLERIRRLNFVAKRFDAFPLDIDMQELEAITYFAYCWVEEHEGSE